MSEAIQDILRKGMLAISTLWVLGCVPKTPKPPGPNPGTEDPVVQVVVPGAYGVPGGNQVYNSERHQISVLESPDGTMTFRLMDAGDRKVVGLYGIPSQLREGKHISLQYRVMVNGYTIQSENYTDVEVLKLTTEGIWLKKDENTFFVLER